MKQMYQESQTSQQKKHQNKALFLNRSMRRIPIVRHVFGFVSSQRTDTCRKILEFLLRLSLLHDKVFTKQATIGMFADVNREQVNRLLPRLARAGLVRVRNRGWNTCIYELPSELFSVRVLNALSGLFSWVKQIAFLGLLASNSSSGTVQRTPILEECLRFSKESIYTEERVWRGVTRSCNLTKKRKSDIVREISNKFINQMGAHYGFTDYAKLLFVCFDDNIIRTACKEFHALNGTIKHPVKWIWSRCKTISEKENKSIDYPKMQLMVKAAGFGPNDRLLMSDRDAQPRYQEKKIPTKGKDETIEQSDTYSRIKQEEPTHPHQDYWLKTFPVPELIKLND